MRRCSERDFVPCAASEEQGVFLRAREPYGCGFASCAVASFAGGTVCAFSRSSLDGGTVLSHIDLYRSKKEGLPLPKGGGSVYSTPLAIDDLAVSCIDSGVFVCWRESIGGEIPLPPSFSGDEGAAARAKTRRAVAELPPEKRAGGCRYAVLSGGEDSVIEEVMDAPASFISAPVSVGGELLWAGTLDGRAAVFRSEDGRSFEMMSKVPAPGDGVCSQASLCVLGNGRCLAFCVYDGDVSMSYSDDMGRTWSVPGPVGIRGSRPAPVSFGGRLTIAYASENKALPIRCVSGSEEELIFGDDLVLIPAPGDFSGQFSAAVCGGRLVTLAIQKTFANRPSSVVFSVCAPTLEGETK